MHSTFGLIFAFIAGVFVGTISAIIVTAPSEIDDKNKAQTVAAS